jgi:hypothetical protein
MHIGKRITAGLLALLLFAGLSLPVCADETDASDAESAAASEKVADIRVTVSIFENIGRSWILAPMQIGIPGDGGVQ